MKLASAKNLITVGLALLLASSCQPKPSGLSILASSSCAPPCWRNLTPGLTTRQEFVDSIKSYPSLVSGSLHDYGAAWQGFGDVVRGRFEFDPGSVTYFDAYFLDDRLACLSFYGDWYLTIGQATGKFGEPDGIVVVEQQGEVFVGLLLEAKGIAFGYSSLARPSWWRSRIEPDIRLSSLDFFAPEAYQAMLEAGLFSYGAADAKGTLERMRPWKGYGPLSQYYGK